MRVFDDTFWPSENATKSWSQEIQNFFGKKKYKNFSAFWKCNKNPDDLYCISWVYGWLKTIYQKSILQFIWSRSCFLILYSNYFFYYKGFAERSRSKFRFPRGQPSAKSIRGGCQGRKHWPGRVPRHLGLHRPMEGSFRKSSEGSANNVTQL